MNWERVKNFLIVLFVFINIFLICFMLSSVKTSSSVNKSVVADTVSILEANGVTVNPKLIPTSISNPGTFDVVALDVDSSYESPKKLTESNAESEIKKAMKVLGLKGYEISRQDGQTYSLMQKVSGYFIFDSGITAKIEDNKITLSGVWYKQQTKPRAEGYKDGGIVYVTGVLIDFINNGDRIPGTHDEITGIEVGYCVPWYDSGIEHKSMSAVPCYSVITADGTRFLYEAAGGTYIKVG